MGRGEVRRGRRKDKIGKDRILKDKAGKERIR